MNTSTAKFSSRWRKLAAAAGFAAAAFGVSANPVAPTIVNGQVSFATQGGVVTITNSPNAIINWASFSINPGEMVKFLQQSNASAVLNRVTGQNPSQILGALQSNGQVYLINPNGIVFGAGAQVNVGGMVASTLAMSDADFLAGKKRFLAGGVAGDVINQGTITTPSGGQVYLIAPNVTNTGILTSPQGQVLLAAGRSVELADSSDPSIHVVVSAPTDRALNLGSVVAQGGRVGIYGALVNQRGVVNANSAVVGENGKIVLRGSVTTLLEAGSATTATGAGNGGEVQVLGTQVGLMDNARVDVSGQTGGGTALIGGDYHGDNAAVMNAQQTYIGSNASVSADAIASGNGGKVIVWADQTTRAYGAVSARGGAQAGDGGFVETSGNYLDVAGIRVDASAPKGKHGTWLLDPYDLNVQDGSDQYNLNDVSAFANLPGNGISIINPSIISNSNLDVVLQARHDINVLAEISMAHPVNLTMQAGNDINVNAAVTTAGGALTLSANDNGGGTASGVGRIRLNAAVATGGGALNLSGYNYPTLAACIGDPTRAECAGVLPSLSSCVITPTVPGCSVVLPGIAACVANPAAPGCSAVLPSLAVCTTLPATPGCSAVLPSLAQCTSQASLQGCGVVLPSLTACTLSPSQAGCAAVLPSLASCTASPTLAGCSAVLPSLASCAASPTQGGCSVVLPSVAACAVSPLSTGCANIVTTSQASPISQTINATINIINTTSASTSSTTTPPSSADKTTDTKLASATTPDATGAANATVKKTFCN